MMDAGRGLMPGNMAREDRHRHGHAHAAPHGPTTFCAALAVGSNGAITGSDQELERPITGQRPADRRQGAKVVPAAVAAKNRG